MRQTIGLMLHEVTVVVHWPAQKFCQVNIVLLSRNGGMFESQIVHMASFWCSSTQTLYFFLSALECAFFFFSRAKFFHCPLQTSGMQLRSS